MLVEFNKELEPFLFFMPKQDSGYKLLFSHPAMFRDFLKMISLSCFGSMRSDSSVMFPVQKISGEWIDERRLINRGNDIAWLCGEIRGTQESKFIVLTEFQTSPDPIMSLRLATYSCLLYEDIYRNSKPRTGKMPKVLPVVIYNGRRKWREPLSIQTLIEREPIEIKGFQLKYKIRVIDQLHMPDDQIPDPDNLMGLLIRIERSNNIQSAVTWIRNLDSRLKEMREFQLQRSVVSWLTESFLPTRIPDISLRELQTIEEITMSMENNTMSWTSYYIAEGRKKGFKEGRKEGRREWATMMLTKQLSRRFGQLSSELVQHLEQADLSILELLAERLLEVQSLDEVIQLLEKSSGDQVT